MPTWAKWVIGLALTLGALAVHASKRPRTWHVEANVDIAAAPEQVYPWIADLRRWPEWPAWSRDADPNVVRQYYGPSAGAGSRMAWGGGADVEVEAGPLDVRAGSRQTGAAGRGRVEIGSASLDGGIEFITTHQHYLALSGFDQRTGIPRANTFSINFHDRDFEIRGSVKLEPASAGTRLTWTEVGDLGSGLLVGVTHAESLRTIERMHAEFVRDGLQRLKEQVEQSR